MNNYPVATNSTHWRSPVFHQKWWLDAVAPGRWRELTVRATSGELIGRMPLVYSDDRLRCHISMPRLTQVLGPWIKPNGDSVHRRFSSARKILAEFATSLPSFNTFNQNFDHSITDWLPFCWNGFEQTTRYTYTIPDISESTTVFQGFFPSKRGDIRKAEKLVTVREGIDPEDLYDLLRESILARRMEMTYTKSLFCRLMTSAIEHNSGMSLFAEDQNGKIHASSFFVWDPRSAYLLVTHIHPEFRATNALALIIWSALERLSTQTRSFDFEGSMSPSVESAYRAFGAQQVPYHRISKTNSIQHQVKKDIHGWLVLLNQKLRTKRKAAAR